MSDLQAFFHMGGYALYVWPAFLISLIVLMGNVMYSKVQFRRVLRETAVRADALAKKKSRNDADLGSELGSKPGSEQSGF